MFAANGTHSSSIFHGDRLSTTGVVGHCQHHQRDALASYSCDEILQTRNIHVALEWQSGRRLTRFGDRKIDGFSAHKLNIRAGRVKVGVVGHDVDLLAGDAEQNAFRRSSLVGWNHVLIPEYV